uniref:TLC domain-containing protein 5 isoform X2 n=1 Tax=Myxine glutinosa TaxID=7769 RepID=UPI00359027A0
MSIVWLADIPHFVWQVVCSSLIWLGLYKLLRNAGGHKKWDGTKKGLWVYSGPEWSCRVVTLIHGLMVIVVASSVTPLSDLIPGGPNSREQEMLFALSLGYFAFDTGWCFFYGWPSFLMFSHHLLSIVALLIPLLIGRSGAETAAALLGTEITNPLLQIRWFLRQAGWYEGTRLGKANDLTFMYLFCIMRVAAGGVLLIKTTYSPHPHVLIKVVGSFIYLVSCVFAWQIVRFAIRKYVFSKQSPE